MYQFMFIVFLFYTLSCSGLFYFFYFVVVKNHNQHDFMSTNNTCSRSTLDFSLVMMAVWRHFPPPPPPPRTQFTSVHWSLSLPVSNDLYAVLSRRLRAVPFDPWSESLVTRSVPSWRTWCYTFFEDVCHLAICKVLHQGAVTGVSMYPT